MTKAYHEAILHYDAMLCSNCFIPLPITFMDAHQVIFTKILWQYNKYFYESMYFYVLTMKLVQDIFPNKTHE